MLVACPPAATRPPEPTPSPAPKTPERRGDPELTTIADAIDPGEVKPLLAAAPTWLARVLEPLTADAADPRAIQRLAREALAIYEEEASTGDPRTALVYLGRAAYLGERLLLAGEDDPETLAILEHAYMRLADLVIASAGTFFEVLLPQITGALGHRGALEEAQIEELTAHLQGALGRAEALRRRAAARLLRDHPDRPETADVLLHLAESAHDRQEHAAAVELARLGLARAQAPTSAHGCALADLCAAALDLACADEGLARARSWTPPDEPGARARHEARLQRSAEQRELAAEAIRLADAPGLDAGLRRGHLLILLGRHADAERAYEALHLEHPGDARPWAGFAKVVLQRDADYHAAAPLLAAGMELEGRDREFFEVVLGVEAAFLLREALPALARGGDDGAALGPLFAAMRDHARELARFDASRGAVLEIFADGLAKIVPHVIAGEAPRTRPTIRRLLGDLERVRVSHPESSTAWYATLAATLVSDDRRRAWAIASAPLPASLAAIDDLQLSRHRALRTLVFLWEDAPRMVADLEAAIELLPPHLRAHPEALETRAFAEFVRAEGGDVGAARRAVRDFRALAERREGPARARALANAAVILGALGDPEGATAAFNAAVPLVDDGARPFLYLIGLILELGPNADEELEALARQGPGASLRLAAAAWWAEVAERRGDPDARSRARAYHAAVTRERAAELRGRLPRGRYASFNATFDFDIYYRVRSGLVIRFEIDCDPWLVPPAPLILADDRPGERPARRAG